MTIKELINETKARININMTLFKFCENDFKKNVYSANARKEIENYVKLKNAAKQYGENYEIK